MTTHEEKLPWPSDAVMIVAANEKEVILENIRGGLFICTCRKCGAALLADTWTVARAQALPERHGRPVLFFCIECMAQHEFTGPAIMEDHRGGGFSRKELVR